MHVPRTRTGSRRGIPHRTVRSLQRPGQPRAVKRSRQPRGVRPGGRLQAMIAMAMVAVTYGTVTIQDSQGLPPIDEKIEKDYTSPSLNVIQPRTNLGTTHILPEYYTDEAYKEDCHRIARNKALREAMDQRNEITPGPPMDYGMHGQNFFVNWDWYSYLISAHPEYPKSAILAFTFFIPLNCGFSISLPLE